MCSKLSTEINDEILLCRAHVCCICAILVLLLSNSSSGQYFDPKLDDKIYLDNLQHKLELELNSTRVRLVEQAKLTEMVAKEFVAATIKENLFLVRKRSTQNYLGIKITKIHCRHCAS